MPAVEALLFDVFGTVVDWRGSLTRQLAQLGQARGISADWEKLVTQWRGLYQPALQEVRSGRRSFVDLDILHRESLDRLLPAFGLGDLGEEDRDRMVRGWHRLDAWPDAVAGLTRLKQAFVVATLSNGGVHLLVNMAKHAGLPWDTVISAGNFRHYKPDREVYLGAAELLARSPASLMLVAAHNNDLHAARACGLQTAYVQRLSEDPRPDGDWDMVARDFVDLANQLSASCT
jgi:2-haloacid dehalogenase